MRRLTYSIILALLPVLLLSQYQNPPLLKWRQIKTPHFTVVFPENISDRGKQVATMLETAYGSVPNSMDIPVRKIPVFIFNQTTMSNGFTTIAPRHMGFFITPPQDAMMVGGTDWLASLTLHEYRHTVQYAKLDQNFTNYMGHFFGDYGRAVCMNWSVPLWAFEGDAICSETAFSEGGRGRMPAFTKHIRALELENKRFTYAKAYMGSYRDYFPNPYHLGYLMASYVRKNYGAEAWSNVWQRSTKLSFSPYAFSGSLRKYTRAGTTRTYKKCFNEFDSIWTYNEQKILTTRFEKFDNPPNKVWTNYFYPYLYSEEKALALKSGLADAPKLVIIEQGEETKLLDINPVDRVHSNGSLVVWASEIVSPRWQQRSYSDIMVYDLQKKKLKRLTKKGKYFAPAISPDGNKIVAVEYTNEMKCSLVILDAKNGEELENVEFPDDQFVRMPSWSEDGQNMVFTVSSGKNRKISVLNSNTLRSIDALPFLVEDITEPVFYKGYIIFCSSVTGIDAIHAINTKTSERFVVAVSRYGVYHPRISSDGNTLVFQNYTVQGAGVAYVSMNPAEWDPLSKIENGFDNYYQYIVDQEYGKDLLSSEGIADTNNYKITKYFPTLHSIDVHSWAPYPVNNGVGLSVFSNDKLNTLSLSAGMNYFPDDVAHREFVSLSYARWFPVINVEASVGKQYEYETDSADDSYYVRINEKILRTGLSFPFDFSRNAYNRSLDISGGYDYIFQEYPDSVDEGRDEIVDVSAIEIGAMFINAKQRSVRDVYPSFGQVISYYNWEAVPGSGTKGYRHLASATLYFPGFFKHHSIVLKGGLQESSEDFREGVYLLTTDIGNAKGYENYVNDQLVRGSVTYALPLFYPDLALGPILYIKRFRAEMFFDYSNLEWENQTYDYKSVGVDLNVECYFFNIALIPLELGVRAAYLIDDEEITAGFLFLGVAF